MDYWYEGNLNESANRRDKDGIVYYIQQSSFLFLCTLLYLFVLGVLIYLIQREGIRSRWN